MPLYEYQCDACGHRFEKIQKFSDAPIDECPNCGAKKVHKLVSSPAIQFKGSGWYITDYAKKGMTAADGSKVGEAKGPEDKGDKGDKGGDKGEKSEKSATPARNDDKPAPKDAKPAAADKSSSSSSTSTPGSSTSSSKT